MKRLLIMLTWGGVVQSLPSYEPLTPNISTLCLVPPLIANEIHVAVIYQCQNAYLLRMKFMGGTKEYLVIGD